MNRRNFLKASAVSTAAFATTTLNAKESLSDEELKTISPTSLEAEFSVTENGNLKINKNQRLAFSRCFGCFDTCGVRVRIDNKTNSVLKVCGNPYSPATQDKPMDLNTPVKEAFLKLSAKNDEGLTTRATVCVEEMQF